jgi:predicted acylesterase/phospholipase RssA
MKNLCFAGGGVKGIAYLGVYKYLLEHDMLLDLENLSGTSAGAIMCLLLLLKYTVEEMQILVEKLNYSLVESFDISGLFKNYSIDNGLRIEYMIMKIIQSKGIDSNITFNELYKITNVGLNICATRLDDCSKVIFNHILTPDVKVYVACKYSINIPFIWSSQKFNGAYYADGCLSQNLPITQFPVEGTLGISCVSNNTEQKINDVKDYMTRSIECCLNRANYFELKSYIEMGYNVVRVKIPKISNIDFDIGIDTKLELIQCGYTSIESNLKANN